MPHPAIASPTAGTSGLVAVDGRTFPLRSAHLDARAEGGLAETLLTQEYANPHPEPLEVLYTMPLPADGAVVGYTFRLGERTVRGHVEPRETAREAYLRALEEGRTAGLVEQQRADTFVQRLGNLPPGATVTVEIRVLHPLAFEPPSRWVYRFPTVVGVRYHGAPGRVHDAASLDAPRADARGTGVRLGGTLRIGDEGGSVVTLDEGALDRDVVRSWPAGEASTRARLHEGPGLEGDGGRYALLVVTPPAATAPAHPRDLTILLDASGSMGGEPLDQAKEIVASLLRSLARADRFELIAFASEPRSLTAGMVDADPAAVDRACRQLAGLDAGGGTEMRRAFEAALAPLREKAQRQVVLVTDGQIGFEEEIVQLLRKRLPERSRVHVVGVGSSPNRTLTLGASRAGRGVEILVRREDDPHDAGQRLVRATAMPVLTEIRVKGSGVVAVAPARPRDVLAGEPLRVLVELKPGGGEVVVRGNRPDRPWSATFEAPSTLPEGVAGLPLGAFFGRERATDLEAEGVQGERMRAVGLRHRIVTSETSLVAIREDATVDPRDPRRVEKLAVELPAGVSAEGVGLSLPYEVHHRMAACDAMPDIALSSRALPELRLRDRLPRFLRLRREPGTRILTGRLIRTDGTEFVVEFEVPEDGFELTGSETATLRFQQTTRHAVIVPQSSTRPGAWQAGQTIRLVLRREDALPVTKNHLFSVALVGAPGGDVVIEVEASGA